MSEMSEQPEALRLADELEKWTMDDFDAAAAELRRLHAENERIGPLAERVLELKAQRDALLEALQDIVDFVDGPVEAKRPDVFALRISKARAAIKTVEGEKE